MKRLALALSLLGFATGAGWAEEPTLESIRADYEQAMEELSRKYREAKTEEERRAVFKESPDKKELAAKVAKLIEENGEDPKVLDSLAWSLLRLRLEPSPKILEIIERHKESKELTGVLLASPYLSHGADRKLREIVTWARNESPHKEVQGVAAYVRCNDWALRLSDEEKLKELKFAEANVGEVKTSRGTKIVERVKGDIFELTQLKIGAVAQEIEGEDQDGVKFKLSDYRGKVVVLDFWGDW